MKYYTLTNQGLRRYRSNVYSDYDAVLDCAFGVKNLEEIKEEMVRYSAEKKKRGNMEKVRIIKSAIKDCSSLINRAINDKYICVVCDV